MKPKFQQEPAEVAESFFSVSSVCLCSNVHGAKIKPKVCFDARPHLCPLPRGEDFGNHGLGDLVGHPANPGARIFMGRRKIPPSPPTELGERAGVRWRVELNLNFTPALILTFSPEEKECEFPLAAS